MSEFSSGLIALHEACYAISMGMATSAIVACAEPPLLTASVEQDAISVLYLKPLHAARRDGNPVCAVIRAAETDYYSSFHEAELPTQRMYETLIRRAYEKAGLDPGHTITVQKTVAPSTAVAEPEKLALQSVFGLERITTDQQKDQPAIGIGMAGLFKAIDWLIRNTPSQNLNGSSPSPPQNDEDLSKQVGVNSFGPRGFNVHAVLESHPAASRSSGEPQHDSSPKRFSMISPDNVSHILRQVRAQCQLLGDYKVEDIYPCTSLQESFMAIGEEQPGSYVHRWVYKLPSGIRSDRLREAWDVVIEQNSILRSRVILFQDQALQVVIADDISWEKPATNLSVHAYVNQVRSLNMTYGSRLNRYAIIQEDDGSSYFIWIAHHAMFDTSSMQTALDSLHRAYHGSDLGSSVPYTNFIRYTQSLNAEAARSYWRNELEGAIRSQYPHSSPTKTSRLSVRRKRISMSLRGGTESRFKQSTILYAAWAMVLSQYCDSSDVCFGTAITGGKTSAFGLSDVSGPTTAEIPIRLLVDAKQSVSEFLECVQSKVSGADAFEQFGLQNISKISQDAKEACNFSNILVMQPENCSSMAALTGENAVLHHGRDEIELSEESLNSYFKYPLVMHPNLENDQFQMDFVYYSDLVSETQLEGIYYHMEHVMKQLVRPIDCPLSEIQVSGPWDISFACNTNQEKPEAVDRCIHEMFEQQVELHGARVAIDAWDLTLTYRELNCAANRLAHRLKNRHGIKPGDLVHVCFEKSAWFFVSVLAANKAGAGWVPLDSSHPLERLQKLVSQSKAVIALSSPNNVSICAELMGESVLEVSQSLDEELKASESSANGCATVSPDEIAYVIFTSGTTGMPKGVVIQHRAFCTSQTDWVRKSGLSPEDRLLQFSSFVFDMMIGETFASLINGTCLCVPSEEDRLNRLADYIQEKSVTWTYQTPSVLRTLDPNDVPGLRTLVIIGEAISQDLVEQWFGKVRLLGAWGPAEACCIAALQEWTAPHESSKCLGRPVGGHNWLVDPSNASQLAPIGAIGEVVIQSPTLLKEYLHDKVKTDSSIVQSLPTWVPHSSSVNWSRWYKTGDLCRYNPDGTFDFVSRKDTQVKINGMRVELEEIERNIRDHLHDVCQVVVDIIRTQAGLNVVAYLCFTDARKSGNFSATDIFELPSEENDTLAAGLVTKLGVKLPRYMIPTCFLHCRFMPYNTSLKADRKRLKQLVSELDRSAITRYSRINTKKVMPETRMECSLQMLWAQVLQLPQETIGRDDGFLEIGGDSISAIKLISACRKKGIGLLTKDVLDSPSLSSVATKAVSLKQGTSTEPLPIRPFSLLGQEAIQKVQSEEMREYCGFSEDQLIEDAFPCSSMQEGLMAVSVRQPGSYVTKFAFKIPEYVDVDLMKASWENAVRQCPNMRSRIVLVDGESIQLVVKEDTAWEHHAAIDPATYLSQQNFEYMGYGTSLSKNTILSCKNGIYFVWMAHHTFHDGWSVNILLDTFEKTYLGSKLDPLAEYPLFIKYTREVDGVAAGEYWSQKLKGEQENDIPAPQPQVVSRSSNAQPFDQLKRVSERIDNQRKRHPGRLGLGHRPV
uniref:Carrier domain-containing protein n=1 Tax=Bionectria ochroleuca TaxID=29856 RepID=A0A8H7N729_BIOOC